MDPSNSEKKAKIKFCSGQASPYPHPKPNPCDDVRGGGGFGQTCVQTKGGLVLVVRLWFGKKGEYRELLTGLDTRKNFPAIPLVRVSRQRGG